MGYYSVKIYYKIDQKLFNFIVELYKVKNMEIDNYKGEFLI